MGTLSNTEIGSVVYNLVENIPMGISGLLIDGTIVNQQCYFAEQFTGKDVDTSAISEAFQPAIMNLTVGNVLGLMEAQGLGTRSVSIGELSITKGMKEGTSQDFKSLGIKQLEEIGQHMSYYQSWG